MSQLLIALAGKSGSGKSAIAEMIADEYGIPEIKTYTTRPRRDEHDNSHKWTIEQYYDPAKVVCETEYGGYRYWTQTDQIVDMEQVIIVDLNGIRQLTDKDYNVLPIFLQADMVTRMRNLVAEYEGKGFDEKQAIEKAQDRISRDTGWDEILIDRGGIVYIDFEDTIEDVLAKVVKVIERARKRLDYRELFHRFTAGENSRACPSDIGLDDIGLEGDSYCYDMPCQECWKLALKRDVEE